MFYSIRIAPACQLFLRILQRLQGLRGRGRFPRPRSPCRAGAASKGAVSTDVNDVHGTVVACLLSLCGLLLGDGSIRGFGLVVLVEMEDVRAGADAKSAADAARLVNDGFHRNRPPFGVVMVIVPKIFDEIPKNISNDKRKSLFRFETMGDIIKIN